jgi:steroid delta-isomerase-like uncharacterized protein
MSAQDNKNVVRRVFEDAFNKNDLTVLDELVTPRVVYHNAPPGLASGIEGYRQLLTMWRTAFPDAHVTIEDMIGEADKVVTRFTGRGTHKGDFMGIAPTGKRVEVTAITVMRLEGGKVTDEWEQVDMLGIMQQLGAVGGR